jgi:hypothetical protein
MQKKMELTMVKKVKKVLSPEALETLRRTAAHARQVRQEKRKERELRGEPHPYTPPKRKKKKAASNSQRVVQWDEIKMPMQRVAQMVQAVTSGRSVLHEDIPQVTHYAAADMVNNPAHYKVGGIETIDFIEAKNLNYNLGNVVKYVTRAGHKGSRKEDLEKFDARD